MADDLTARWSRSPECEDAACVEIAETPESVLVRNSSDPDVVLSFTHAEWQAFLSWRTRDG